MSPRNCVGIALSMRAVTGGADAPLGPTVTPTWNAAGTGSNALSNPTPSYPANSAGDLFILRVYCNGGSASTPAGWTLIGSATDGTVTIYVFSRDTRATGSDSGTITVTASGSPVQSQIDVISNVATGTFTEGLTTATSATSTLNMPTVTTSGNSRLAIAAIGCNSDVGMNSATGETGGDWTEATPELTSGLGAGLQVQTAAMSSGGSISGGSMTHNGTRAVCVAFALVGV